MLTRFMANDKTDCEADQIVGMIYAKSLDLRRNLSKELVADIQAIIQPYRALTKSLG